ncbi:putative Adenylate cyclase [Planktothrix sp. PCC 11201]|uniref:adenylate/guanylate cyclase domain-containing protein n=1 Tax=Planktothrix sp. PCC 11201 TaxID=1729650 RepID=UPI00091C3501|nr:adenylate/guanylate cyclase domain-containing protein [Planktothrix sp. PCC 11201]SKB14525.1 putative Adenylate cyclase [Planktothrix sp. PCC 11201]
MKKITKQQKTTTSISLKTMLTGFIVLTISFTTAIVYLPWFFTSKKNIAKIVTQINEEIALSTSKEFTDLFQNVYYAQDFIRSAINRDLVDINNPEERDRFFLSILQSNPSFSFVQFAYPNGDYVGAQRVTTAFEKQNTFKLHFRQWDEERKLAIKTTDNYELVGQKLQLIKTTQIEEPNWYTPGRPWYRDALKTPGQAAWTVYVYRSTNTPGIDSNIALYKEQTNNIYWQVENPPALLGVIGVGFEFKQISRRLQEQQKGRSHIEVFVINSQGEMIASTDPNEHSPIQIKGQDQPQLQLLKYSKNPYFQLAVKTLEEQAVDLKLVNIPQQWISKNPQNGKYYYVSLTPAVTPMNQLDWFIGTVIPEDQYMGKIKKNNQILLGFVTILILGTTGLVITVSDQLLVKPINQIKEVTHRVENGDLEVKKLEIETCQELSILTNSINNMIVGLRERQRERDIFGRVVSPEVREKLLQGQLKLGGELCWVSVLFTDIRNFSTLSEQMQPQEVVAFLNEYLTEMTDAIRPWGGYVNNFIGDAIVVIFGAPLSPAETEWRSVAAALTMRERLEELNQRRIQRGEVTIQAGIGISSGEVVAGQIGSLERLLYTVIGDAVNVAARLETLTKEYPEYTILINESTATAIAEHHHIVLKSLGEIKVKGRQKSVEVYAVLDWKKEEILVVT